MGQFQIDSQKPLGWTHVVLNYIGPKNGEGIKILYDGAEVASDTTRRTLSPRTAATDRIVLGRFYLDRNERYSSVKIDELVFFNQSLKSAEVQQLLRSFKTV